MPEVSNACMFLIEVKEISESCRQTYSKLQDAAQIYEIKTKITSTKQGNCLFTQYARTSQNLWQELDHYQCIVMKHSDNVALVKNCKEKERIYRFPVKLNIEFFPTHCKC